MNTIILKSFNTLARKRSFVAMLLILGMSLTSKATIVVTKTSASICSNYASAGASPKWTALGTMTLREGTPADMGTSGNWSATIVLTAPAGWQFNSAVAPTIAFTAAKNVVSIGMGAFTSTSLTFSINGNNKNKKDKITITSLQVQPTSTSAAAGSIKPSSVTGTLKGITTSSIFGSVALSAPVSGVTDVTVATSPSSDICAGTSVTFTADATNGGTTPAYQWKLNGANISGATNDTYTNSALTNGNTIVCSVISYSCITSPTAISPTTTMTVNPVPSAIAGASAVCAGSSITLTNSLAGTWSSSNTDIASVDAVTGAVTGTAVGTATITFATEAGCTATKTIAVNDAAGAISGTTILCAGTTSSLTNTTTGTWSASTAGIATINATTGVLTGVAAGTTTISLTRSNGCYATTIATINAAPANITGTTTVCAGLNTTLANTVAGGTWTSGNTAIATVAGGIVTGVAAGTAVITYTLSSGCAKTAIVTVNASPAAISGTNTVCRTATTTLSSTAGGAWSSSTTTVATVSAGIVTGINQGTATISYNFSNGCRVTTVVTVRTTPAAISGTASVCSGVPATLTNTSLYGTWSSANTTVANVSTTGVVTGVNSGTATISYTTGCGTAAARVVTVSNAPVAGTFTVCTGYTTTLTNAAAGGTWSSGNTSIATIGSTGIVSGITGGTATISYTNGACVATAVVTVNIAPAPITGSTNICQGSTTTLANTSLYGSWSSANTGIATIGSTNGVVTGVAEGATVITYNTGCGSASTTFTVNVLPEEITGLSTVCVGSPLTLTSSGAGTWSSANASVATIGATNGIITGVAAGTSGITYALATGCSVNGVVTVNPIPAAIVGTKVICQNATTTLASTPGGTWSSSNPSVATVGSTGVVSGLTAGITTISYTLPTGCGVSAIVTVNPIPAAISGTVVTCAGSATTLANETAGGTWTSSISGVATINASTGIVTGVAAGTSNITYTLTTGCRASKQVTINALPAAISGTATACIGSTTTLSNTGGGAWSSLNTGVATVNASGVVTSVATGTTTIRYTLSTGCSISKIVTINTVPATASITGTPAVCLEDATVLTSSVSGGAWSSADTTVDVDAVTGEVFGIDAGTATITYAITNSCGTTSTTTAFTVSEFPTVDAITGAATVCQGETITLTNATVDGAWSSADAAIATTGATGIITGASAGTTTISYTVSNVCGSVTATQALTVNAAPVVDAISGAAAVCAGSTLTLSNATIGGTWSSSDASIVTVSSTGIATGVAYGTATISYAVANSCGTTIVTAPVNVHVLPAAIGGPLFAPVGGNVIFTQPEAGGVWTSSDAMLATVNTTGIVAGIAPGTATISYTLTNACGTNSETKDITVVHPGTWAGTTSTDWNNTANWLGGFRPNDTTNAIIAAGTTYVPAVNSAASAKNLNIAAGATVTITSPATLSVKGDIANAGVISGTGAVILNGSATQSISGRGKYNNMTIANNATIATGADDTVAITGTILPNAGTFTTNGRLLLVSTAAGSGRIGTITGGTISGNVVVQQYVQGGRRAYRFFGHPFSSSIALDQLMPYMDITGTTGTAGGFTATSVNNASCFWYNSYTANSTVSGDPGWVAFNNTNGVAEANKFKPYMGVRLFFRGAKGEGLTTTSGYTISPVTVQMYGPVNQGTQNIAMSKGTATHTTTGASTQDYNLISNPYASAVNVGAVVKAAYDAGKITGSSFWVWNPHLGTSGQFQAVPIDGAPYYIPANSSFQVRTSADGNVLTFTEAHKAGTTAAPLLKTRSEFVTLKVYDADYQPYDMVHIKFDNNATDNEDAKFDAVKPSSPSDLNFYSISGDAKQMNIDARSYGADKVIPLGITSHYAQEFIIRADDVVVPENGEVHLFDKYLQQSTLLTQGTEYRFSITNDSATQGNSRFELRTTATKGTAATSANMKMTLSPNPATTAITVSFTATKAENANITVSNIAGQVVINNNVAASADGNVTLSLEKLPAGIYMVTLTSGNEKSIQKFVKE